MNMKAEVRILNFIFDFRKQLYRNYNVIMVGSAKIQDNQIYSICKLFLEILSFILFNIIKYNFIQNLGNHTRKNYQQQYYCSAVCPFILNLSPLSIAKKMTSQEYNVGFNNHLDLLHQSFYHLIQFVLRTFVVQRLCGCFSL